METIEFKGYPQTEREAALVKYIEQMEASRSPGCYESSHSDSERLEWLLRHITGSELRDMGLGFSWTGDISEARKLIDSKLDS